ncbi:hypothetical protein AvCA_45880 [Azotobacter vinelandii CA]|uniref:DUF4124 domain-containing protein n=2 Tax=Azotobacter vinelandii TaxID=354 RepID=C1DHW5_AZOVD|nr:DUF4124 domain-containing protein [Azotobacter vinelandii]ACO80698.1 conserved hypothetical protein [Azotobacter vinelandii DJ]AGK14313.1 hypothetical protein AvCA_45880 [Azotobacter vinelandii CA]AGK22096.1 hypothetical protein AvCA6_45880 [Azotobacter vinelandii CA6]SFY24345.1 protein of unknown function [Azotobacter vinelandii]GLK61658.1 penicillin-binding protein [Azotobacter vinelandii]
MRILPFSLALLAFPATAGIYSQLDEQGNRVFTNRPLDGASAIHLSPTNSMPAPATAEPAPGKPSDRTKKPGYRWLRILAPEPDATVRDAGALTVTAVSEPGLHPGHRYRLRLDDTPVGPGGSGPVFSLDNLERGTHSLAVDILDAEGRLLESSPEQAVHVKRPSLIQKRLARPCQFADYGVRPECPQKDKPAQKRDIPYIPFL